jgi:hypothetical protein
MQAFADLIQGAINLGIPLDHVPQSPGETVYLQQSIIWVTFLIGLFMKGLGKLMGGMLGGVR